MTKHIDVTGDLGKAFLHSMTAKGPDGSSPNMLLEKQYPEIKLFKVSIWPNESQHRGRPHCAVRHDKGQVSVDIMTGEVIAGDPGRWASAIKHAVLQHSSELQELWNSTRPDDQKLK